MIKKAEKRVELLRTALSESAVVPFAAVDQPLVTELCEIIGSLHRQLEYVYSLNSKEIERWIESDIYER